MDFVFSKHQEVNSIKQALKLLASEENSEKIEFAKTLVAQGWIEFEKESYDSYGEIVDGSWWVVHPSIAGRAEWQDYGFNPVFQKVDTALYYDLFQAW